MSQETLPPGPCLAPETLGAMAEGRLAGAERDAAVRHLARCRRCHEVLASSLQILEEEGALPTPAPVPIVMPRRSGVALWLSAAAAALASAVVFIQRAPVPATRFVAESPAPAVTPGGPAPPSTAVATPSPVTVATLPPEATEALGALGGFASSFRGASGVGFAEDPRGRSVARGIADVDAAAAALASRASPPPVAGTVDEWRRVGRVLEASRLALVGAERPERFFASPWAARELAEAGRVLRAAGVPDAGWPDDVRRTARPEGEAAQTLLDRLDALLETLG